MANDDLTTAAKRRHIGSCAKADPEYGAGVGRALGLSLPV